MKRAESIVVGLAGKLATGKSTVAHHLETRFGLVYLRPSLIFRKLLEDQGRPVDDATLQDFGQKIFDEIGGRGIADLVMRDYDPTKSYVIDGIRHSSDCEYYRERFGSNFYLIYLDASEDARIERYRGRDSTRATSLESFHQRSQHLVEQEIPLLVKEASVVLTNIDLDNTLPQIDALVMRWLYGQELSTMQEMVEAVLRFHRKNDFSIDTQDRQVMYYRMGLLVEELGEINQCLSKGVGDIGEEHADLLILLIGNCVTWGIDLEKEFWKKYGVVMQRKSKQVGGYNRVSAWDDTQDLPLEQPGTK